MPVRVRMKITTEELLGNIQTSRIRRGKNCKKVVKSDHFFVFERRCGPGDASPGPFCFLIAFISIVCTKQKCYEKKSFLCLLTSDFRLVILFNKQKFTPYNIDSFTLTKNLILKICQYQIIFISLHSYFDERKVEGFEKAFVIGSLSKFHQNLIQGMNTEIFRFCLCTGLDSLHI